MQTFFIILAIVVVLLYYFRKDIKGKISPGQIEHYTIDDQFNSDKKDREKEIDSLLAKMGDKGIADLSARDRKRLEELSKK